MGDVLGPLCWGPGEGGHEDNPPPWVPRTLLSGEEVDQLGNVVE